MKTYLRYSRETASLSRDLKARLSLNGGKCMRSSCSAVQAALSQCFMSKCSLPQKRRVAELIRGKLAGAHAKTTCSSSKTVVHAPTIFSSCFHCLHRFLYLETPIAACCILHYFPILLSDRRDEEMSVLLRRVGFTKWGFSDRLAKS